MHEIRNIDLVIDNKQAVYLLAGTYLAKEQFSNDFIQKVHKVSYNIYSKYEIITNIQWCKGHVWSQNEYQQINIDVQMLTKLNFLFYFD